MWRVVWAHVGINDFGTFCRPGSRCFGPTHVGFDNMLYFISHYVIICRQCQPLSWPYCPFLLQERALRMTLSKCRRQWIVMRVSALCGGWVNSSPPLDSCIHTILQYLVQRIKSAIAAKVEPNLTYNQQGLVIIRRKASYP